jgi:hypothetical protein
VVPKRTTKKQSFDPNTYPLPAYVDPEQWRDWNAIRKELGKPLLLPSSCEYQLRKLAKFEALFPGGANESLYNSIENTWQGLFAPDKNNLNYTVREMERLFA